MNTFAKLKSGAWGVRLTGADASAAAGDAVAVTKRDGTTSTVVVAQVVWAGADATLVTIGGQNHSHSDNNSATYRAGGRCGCDQDCCRPRCRCDAHCNCRGGNIYDC